MYYKEPYSFVQECAKVHSMKDKDVQDSSPKDVH